MVTEKNRHRWWMTGIGGNSGRVSYLEIKQGTRLLLRLLLRGRTTLGVLSSRDLSVRVMIEPDDVLMFFIFVPSSASVSIHVHLVLAKVELDFEYFGLNQVSPRLF